MIKIAVIGGGASGLFAAISAKKFNASVDVTVYEKLDRCGKKLLATGNGRCNLTNSTACEIDADGCPTHYHGKHPDFAACALSEFNTDSLIGFFASLGMSVRIEEDKYFPYSEQAGTVLDILRLYAEKLGVIIITGSKIDRITKSGAVFNICGESYDRCIICCGGKSSPHLGSDGSGYELLKSFGHKCSPLYPAITQIKTDTQFVKQLKGIKTDADVCISVGGKPIRSEYGQVLFADYGLSGPPVFQLSGIAAKNYNSSCIISLDLMHDRTVSEIADTISGIVKNSFMRDLTAENILTPLLNKRLGQVIIKYCGYSLNTPANAFKRADIMKISAAIKKLSFTVVGVQGFSNAQVTAGGIYTDEFDNKTMMSHLCGGLYAAGEVLDIDGDCGGFNLQWAFSSGYIAGRSAAYDKNK